MRFDLDADQEAIMASVSTLLGRRAGPSRARDLGGDAPAHDDDLDAALAEAGFFDLFASPLAGPLGAALVVEAVARHAGLAHVGARALVAPALGVDVASPPVALVDARAGAPVRFGSTARTALVLDGEEVRVCALAPADRSPVRSRFGYPMARLELPRAGDALPSGSASRMRDWWRVALATEIAGTLQAALDLTVTHVTDRQQFGRAIGSFQAVQHGLAECAVVIDATRWLAFEAAWLSAPAEAAATALTCAVEAAELVLTATHQFSGAIGFTGEYDLHLWTMRLPALQAEAQALGAPARVIAEARW